jgi:hypothetical protein
VCLQQQFGFAWNHGDVNPEITTTWLGLVGPGVDNQGVVNSVWSDHTDIRPTMMMLLGLQDDYTHDGRALFEVLDGYAVPPALRTSDGALPLAQIYKQFDAPVGELGLASLRVSTAALKSGSAIDDSTYTNLENQLIQVTQQRDALAGQISSLLEGAEFNNQPINDQQAQSLIDQAQSLLDQVNSL